MKTQTTTHMKPHATTPAGSPLEVEAERLEAAPVVTEPQVMLPAPPKNHVYVPIPEDIPRRSITSDGLHGLCRIDGGNLIDEMDGHLRELIHAVQTLGKKGKMKIAIEVTPGGHQKVAIAFDVTSSPPKEKRHPYPLFTTATGQLVTRDPDQMEMDLRQAAPAPSSMRSAAPPPSTPLRTVA